MLNNKNDLSNIPTINNDGHSYIIPMDMYKEGYWAYNISNYFKARVDDNGTPFMIRWYKHGQLANILGLRPFIRGRVGGYTIDDSNATANPKIVMDENASTVDWTGETTDTQAGGIAIYRNVNQCYPQSGIFYGQVGLCDSTGDHVVTGIDIIFKVLDGNVNMLGARKYYVSELTKAMLEFQSKMDQHDRDFQAQMAQNNQAFQKQTEQLINDARSAYTKETQNTHDALVAAQAQIQANRDEQANLSERLAGTEQQIKIHNVATLDQFTSLSKQALERLGNIGAQPQYYDTVEAMKAANPNGTNNLCETVKDGHRWLYVNGAWQDCGAVKDNAFKAARDASQDIMYGCEITDWHKSDKGTVVLATEDFANFESKPIMHLQSTNTDDYVYIESNVVPVSGNIISMQFPEMIRNLSRSNTASCEIRQLTPTDNPDDISTFSNNSIWIHFNDQEITLYKATNLKLNNETDRIQIVFQIHDDIGDVYVGTPKINYGSRCIPYTPMTLIEDLEKDNASLSNGIINTSQNLMYGQTLSSLTPMINATAVISDDPNVQFANTPIMHIEETQSGRQNSFISNEISVDGNIISVQLPEMIVGQDYPNSHVYLTIYPLAEGEAVGDQTVNQKAIVYPLSNTIMQLGKFENIKLPDGTERIAIRVSQDGIGHLFFGIPAVNYGPKCIAYSPSYVTEEFDRVDKKIESNFQIAQLNSQNLLYGQDIRNWTNGVSGEVSLSTDQDKQFSETPIMHIKGTEAGQSNNWTSDPIPVTSDLISLQVPQMSQNEVYGQSSVYLRILPLAEGEKIGDDTVNKKVIAYSLGNTTLSLSKYEGIKLPVDTKQIAIGFAQQGIGDLFFGIPTVNYGSVCIAYNNVLLGNNLDLSSATIPQLYIDASSDETGYDKTPVSFKLVRNSGIDYGYLVFDIQGDSSRAYPKKNFKLKLFSDPEGKSKLKMRLFPTWQKNNKYNIKANWIDATQARNIVNARLIKDALTTVSMENPTQTGQLLRTEGVGQVDGLPIELYFNDGYYGLCTLNTKKDEVTFGMDSKKAENEVLSTELSAKDFMNPQKNIDGKDWSTEIHDTASDDIKAGLNSFQKFVKNSTDDDFKAHIKDYIDVKSVMIEILYGWLSAEGDYYSKSELLATWNGGKYWYLIPYDLDTTWNLNWNGSSTEPDTWFSFSNANTDNSAITSSGNLLHERIIKLFKSELKELAQQLRAGVWSTPTIIKRFQEFIGTIPESVYQRDHERWPEIPSLKITDFVQIQNVIIQRGQKFDDYIGKL